MGEDHSEDLLYEYKSEFESLPKTILASKSSVLPPLSTEVSLTARSKLYSSYSQHAESSTTQLTALPIQGGQEPLNSPAETHITSSRTILKPFAGENYENVLFSTKSRLPSISVETSKSEREEHSLDL